MKVNLPFVAALLASGAYVSGQVGDTITLGATCSYLGERLPATITLFSSNNEAETAIKRITDAAGLVPNFDVQAGAVPNAAATIRGDRRLIIYNPFFMTEMREKAKNQWAPLVILAHEIGHHLQGHTLTRTGSSPKIELEADQYSGFILQKLGASLRDVKSALESLPDSSQSGTHPPKAERLTAVGSGWFKACDPNCPGASSPAVPRSATPNATPSSWPTSDVKNQSPTDSKNQAAVPPAMITSGPNSCKYANDDDCDEPLLCAAGTDTADCQGASARQNRNAQMAPSLRVASVCATVYGTCPMFEAIVQGSACTCYTLFGPIPGIAR